MLAEEEKEKQSDKGNETDENSHDQSPMGRNRLRRIDYFVEQCLDGDGDVSVVDDFEVVYREVFNDFRPGFFSACRDAGSDTGAHTGAESAGQADGETASIHFVLLCLSKPYPAVRYTDRGNLYRSRVLCAGIRQVSAALRTNDA
jgi:hypothetical protein